MILCILVLRHLQTLIRLAQSSSHLLHIFHTLIHSAQTSIPMYDRLMLLKISEDEPDLGF